MFNKTLKHSQFTNTTDYCSNLNTQINRTKKQTHYTKDHNNPKRRGKLEKKKERRSRNYQWCVEQGWQVGNFGGV